jgi:hypothetical protein
MDSAFSKLTVPLDGGAPPSRKRARSTPAAAAAAPEAGGAAPAPSSATAAAAVGAAPAAAAAPAPRAAGSRRASRGAPRLPASADPRAGRTLFVGNLPVAATRPALRRFVEAAAGAGAVESVRFRSVPVAKMAVAPGSDFRGMIRAAVATGSLNEARDSMNAYVVLRDAAAVAGALALNGALFSGRHVRVDAAAGGGGGGDGGGEGGAPAAAGGGGGGGATRYDHKRTVFVGNLPFDAGEEAVRAAFERCGAGGAPVAVEAVRIVRDRATLMGKGFCFVLFAERAGVLDALGLHGTKVAALGGRPLRVVRCTADGKPAAGKHAPAGGKHAHAGGKRAASSGGGGGGGARRGAPAPPAAAHMGARGAAFAAKQKPALPQAKGLVAAKAGKRRGAGKKPRAGGGAGAAAAGGGGGGGGAAPPQQFKKARTLVEGWAAAAVAVSK